MWIDFGEIIISDKFYEHCEMITGKLWEQLIRTLKITNFWESIEETLRKFWRSFRTVVETFLEN